MYILYMGFAICWVDKYIIEVYYVNRVYYAAKGLVDISLEGS
jgi:hypothetical protein